MAQKDKELLLSDILGRLQYGVKAHYKYYDFVGGTERLVSEDDAVITGVNTTLRNPIEVDGYCVEVEYVKPYLRPMSSMTEEEKKERLSTFFTVVDTKMGLTPMLSGLKSIEYIDWLNAHYFDYHGFIEKGLAIEAPEGMYI